MNKLEEFTKKDPDFALFFDLYPQLLLLNDDWDGLLARFQEVKRNLSIEWDGWDISAPCPRTSDAPRMVLPPLAKNLLHLLSTYGAIAHVMYEEFAKHTKGLALRKMGKTGNKDRLQLLLFSE